MEGLTEQEPDDKSTGLSIGTTVAVVVGVGVDKGEVVLMMGDEYSIWQ